MKPSIWPRGLVPSARRAFSELRDPRTITSFEQLGLASRICTKFPVPRDVQKKMLTVLQSGRSVIARSPPGSGKSVAAALALSKGTKEGPLKNLILVPTGTLAQQYAKLLSSLKIPVRQLYRTGKEYNDEMQHRAFISGCSTLVATPTRLLDYMSYDTSLIDVTSLETLVIDELEEYEKKGKVTGLEVLTGALLDRAENPALLVLSSVERPLEFQQLAGLFEAQGKKRSFLEVSTDWDTPKVGVYITDPNGNAFSESSIWKHNSKVSNDRYVEALAKLWNGDGIVVVPPTVSPRDIAQSVFAKLKHRVRILHEQDLVGINFPDLKNLYILGWEQKYDLEKLVRTPQGSDPAVRIALTPAQTTDECRPLLAANNLL